MLQLHPAAGDKPGVSHLPAGASHLEQVSGTPAPGHPQPLSHCRPVPWKDASLQLWSMIQTFPRVPFSSIHGIVSLTTQELVKSLGLPPSEICVRDPSPLHSQCLTTPKPAIFHSQLCLSELCRADKCPWYSRGHHMSFHHHN